MIKLVVIDFDDTLSLNEQAFFVFENYIAQKLGFRPMSRAAHQKNWGKPVREAIVERIPGINVNAFMDLHKKELPAFVKRGKADVVSKRNLIVLDSLIKRGKTLVILTSRTMHEVVHLTNKNNPLHMFIKNIYHLNNTKYAKPDPRVFDEILSDFAVRPFEALYIGDSVIDGVSAKGAGMKFIALLESGLRSKEDFSSVHVDFFAQTFPDILEYIQ